MKTLKERFMIGYSKYGLIGGVVGTIAYVIGFIVGYIQVFLQYMKRVR